MSKQRTRLVIEKDTVYELDQLCMQRTARRADRSVYHKKRLSGDQTETDEKQKK